MLTYVLTGYRVLRIEAAEAADFLELCRRQGLCYGDFSVCADGAVTLCMRSATAKKALDGALSLGLSVTVVKKGGLPLLLRRWLRRPGLWVGGILGICMLLLSTRFVWDVRVSGHSRLTEGEVEEALRACGFGVGSYLGDFKADRTENRVLLREERIAWISVNMRGTVAYVQIREKETPPKPSEDTPANLIADIGGQIVRVELIRGNVLVSAGKWVDEGDLLISGIYEGDQSGIRYTHAEGRVYARVVEEIVITIPLTYEQKTYTTDQKEIFCEKSLLFFENIIKFSKKTFNSGQSCDIIERVSVPFPTAGVGFPIALQTRWYVPYTVTQERRTHAEAEALAYQALARRIGAIQGGAEVLSKTITTTLGEDVYVLTCTLTCIRDIAKEQTFEVLP